MRKRRMRELLIAFISIECVGLPLRNVKFLYAYFQVIISLRTEPEVLRVQNLHAL